MRLIGITLAALRGISPAMWLAVLIATTGTNLLDFLTLPQPGAKPDVAFIASVAIRVVVVLWIAYALQRQLGGGNRPFRPSLAMARFVALTIAGLILSALFAKLATIARGPGPVPLATDWLYAFVAMALLGLLTIQLLAWTCALAVGQPFRALPAIWSGQQGHVGAIAGAYVGLVLPIAAAHLALSIAVVRLPIGPQALIIIGVIDGIVSAFQLAMTDALAAVAWRLSRRIDGAAPTR
jgi:hypothetical protein